MGVVARRSQQCRPVVIVTSLFLILLLILISCSLKALNTSAAMMSTAKDSSIFTQLLSRTFTSRTAQVVAPATSTEKQQQPLSSSSDKLNSSSQRKKTVEY
ncbi:hypothetical protein GCK32_017629 [Trichostrongylus colubriformis]|uniref:Uncharacterized protein n=1 Tax=Trichostrongylus colubriformis TaxID=6319 RepID=A0AAN8EZ80_TRICO